MDMEQLERLESDIMSWTESIECEENDVKHVMEASRLIDRLYALVHKAYRSKAWPA